MMGLLPDDIWKFTPSELNVYAREYRRRELKQQQKDRYETAIICSWVHNAAGPKVAKSPEAVYKKMEIKDPEEHEHITGPRRVYKGSLKSQLEQHIKWLDEQKKKRPDAGNH